MWTGGLPMVAQESCRPQAVRDNGALWWRHVACDGGGVCIIGSVGSAKIIEVTTLSSEGWGGGATKSFGGSIEGGCVMGVVNQWG